MDWLDKIKLVYEPIPSLCIPSEMHSLRKVLPYIEVFSPNHEEAGTFFSLKLEQDIEGDYTNVYDTSSGIVFENVAPEDKQRSIQGLAQRFLDEGAKRHVVIRSGKMGCYLLTRPDPNGNQAPKTEAGTWLPAYYQPDTVEGKVVDVTGAGNAFLVRIQEQVPSRSRSDTPMGMIADENGPCLRIPPTNMAQGGLIAGLSLEHGNIQLACLYGSVSSSYTIEQYGLPSLTDPATGIWNGSDKPSQRLAELRSRVGI